MNASCGTRRPSRGEVRVSANSSAPTAVATSANTYAHVESASTWMSSAERLPSAAIWASERSTKITSRAITCSPRYDSMATSTMQATNGGIISCKPLIMSSESVARGAAAAERADELRDPQVHEIEVGVDPGGPTRVGRNDHRLRARLLRHLLHLAAVVIVRRQQHLDVLLPHLVDHLEHVAGRGRDAGLGLDIVDAGEPVLPREIVPLLVITSHRLAAKRHRLFEPPAQPVRERRALILLRLEEVEQLALPVQIGERRAAEQLHQLVPEEGAVHPVLEVLLPRREVVGVLGRHAPQARQDVARDLHGVQRVGPDVRVAVHMDVPLRAREAR